MLLFSVAMDSSIALKSISLRLCRFICPVGCAGAVFSIVFDRSLRSFLISDNREARTFPSSLELPPPAMPIPSRPSTKDSGSKSRRSFIPSPTPTNLTGSPSSRLTATTLPPLALPSSFVSMRPVKPNSLSHCLALSKAMRPCAASITSRVSCGTLKLGTGLTLSSNLVDMRFCMTLFILTSSAVSASLLLSRPDVSTRSTSYSSLIALSRAP
mmetsp:Transcript_16303/g.37711  ORF Transcript_16303/g.37711 Transcript_16303/m.37711 type:complete len:213 (+) Transcript_16303:1312-1950(+)